LSRAGREINKIFKYFWLTYYIWGLKYFRFKILWYYWQKKLVKCPYCKENRDKVIDSRSSEAGRVIRRRRHCLACGRRFTTYEKIGETFKFNVIKKDNSRVPYDREKVISGLQKACYKRPVSAEQIQQIADKVEEDIFRYSDKEVSSKLIGESTMKHLKAVDKVAYIRFASVYRQFTDAGELIDEVSQAILESDDINQPKLFTD
jgi:transcriptional repressor NrdR